MSIIRASWGTVLACIAACFFWWDDAFDYFMFKAELTNFGGWW